MGELIYGSYDQKSLDLEYDMRIRCPHFAESFAKLEVDCARVVERFDCRLDVPFGEGALERLDIWPGSGGAPILLFIHGGYWRAFDKSMFRFMVERFVEAGACVVLNNYDLCPHVTMDTITEQNRRALAWIRSHASEIGGDPDRIHVTGHSAGGHLTAMLLATQWAHYGLPDAPIRSACALSGLFDLEPLRLSYLNADLRMDEETTRRNSPIHHLPDSAPELIVAVGGGETDEFRRQSRSFADAWLGRGLPGEYMEVLDLDHVNVSAEYQRLESPLTRALFEQMELDHG